MTTNYQRGRAFEYRARDRLKKLGAAYVMRAAQSKGQVDLLALWPAREEEPSSLIVRGRTYQTAPSGHGYTSSTAPWLVQCKYSIHGGGRLSPGEGAALVALAEQTGGIPVFARPGKNGRGVEFIDLTTKEPIG